MAKISESHGSQRGTEHVASCRSTFAPRRPSSARLCPVVRPRASTRRPRRAGSRSAPNHKDPGFRPNSQEIAENLDEFWHFGVHFLGLGVKLFAFWRHLMFYFWGYYIRETWKWNTLGAKTTGSCKIANISPQKHSKTGISSAKYEHVWTLQRPWYYQQILGDKTSKRWGRSASKKGCFLIRTVSV
jgi:hypothetical protein